MLINSSNARAMAARSAEVRKRRKLAAGPMAAPTAGLREDAESQAAFIEQSLSRVRGQITLLSNRLTVELQNPKADPMTIDRLTRSVSALEETERKLSGRSLPPTIKASPPKRERERGTFVDPT